MAGMSIMLRRYGNSDFLGHKGEKVVYELISMPANKQKLSTGKVALPSALRSAL